METSLGAFLGRDEFLRARRGELGVVTGTRCGAGWEIARFKVLVMSFEVGLSEAGCGG